MLKRQRPSSPPPPFSSSVPFVSDTPGDLIAIEQHGHQSKRRRTAPPTLDGPSRGWATKCTSTGSSQWLGNHAEDEDVDDDDEEDDDECPSDEQGDDALNASGSSSSSRHNQFMPHASEYKSTNTMLRELHTLHQHRLLFSTPSNHQTHLTSASTSPLIPYENPSFPSPSSRPHSHSNSFGHSLENQNPPLDKNNGVVIPQSDKSRISLLSPQLPFGPRPDKGCLIVPASTATHHHMLQHPHQHQQQLHVQDKLSEETTRVSERYESTNRLIGSWFLSRRRALDSIDEQYASGSGSGSS